MGTACFSRPIAAFSASRWAGVRGPASSCSGAGNSSGGRTATPLGSSHQITAAAMPITISCHAAAARGRLSSAVDSATASESICSSRSTACIRLAESVVDLGSAGRASELAVAGG